MKYVQPIRDLKKIEEIKNELKKKSDRDHVLFVLGINTGLRISDILPLRVGQVRNTTHLDIIEKKTQKRKVIKINRSLRFSLNEYIAGKADHEFLFVGRSKKHKTGSMNEPIDSSTVYKTLRAAADKCGVKDIGTHSLRKTFGYHFYKKEKDIALLMDLFNHTEAKVTLRYIGIIQDTLDDAFDRFSL